ncbi:unnamed protein product [Phytomonas sp. EM1]|nr:unnamed protein product [Phytomonas sp. EM1]|eukprot:CCW63063.1 unnamed protein product [Phytomonas sp. isolate EM1]
MEMPANQRTTKRSRSPCSDECRARSPSTVARRVARDEGGAQEDVAVFIFRRDLRLADNTALWQLIDRAAAEALRILPLFFFNPLQADPAKNPYFGDASFQVMLESLEDLDSSGQLDGRLVCLRGADEECLAEVQQRGFRIRLLAFNADFTPFALVRDARLLEWCHAHQVESIQCRHDYTLLPLDTVLKQDGQPYSVFTPFYRRFVSDFANQVPPPRLAALEVARWFVPDGQTRFQRVGVLPTSLLRDFRRTLSDRGGRTEGLRRLDRIATMSDYDVTRDLMALDATSHLSPHLKFGTVSIREAWDRAVRLLGLPHSFTRQLLWREFYAMLLEHHPRLVGGQLRAVAPPAGLPKGLAIRPRNEPFLAKYQRFRWAPPPAAAWAAFQAGRTGVPLVDAAVRCLNETGWCPNRGRMLLASFLVKVLAVDWREGERWYASKAVDYDVAANNGGWLWSAGQGADAQPYFRTFNPFRQSLRYDPDGVFIRAWVPELRGLPPAILHTWDAYCRAHGHRPCGDPNDGARLAEPCRSDGDGNAKPPSLSGKKGKWGVRYVTAYPAPIVDIKACTQAVIQEFKKYDVKN